MPSNQLRNSLLACVVASGCMAHPAPAKAGVFDYIFGGVLYGVCVDTGGEKSGCDCAVKVIDDTFDEDFVPIVRDSALSADASAKAAHDKLGYFQKLKLGLQVTQFTATAAYQCQGANAFIARVALKVPA